MALQGREIKNRLRSIKNSKKITKAMELVSAAKMRRAVQSALNTRTYSNLLWDIIRRVKPTDSSNIFFDKPKGEHTTIVLFTSNRGLCGAFNSNVIKKVIQIIKEIGRDNVTVVAIGKKGVSTLNNIGIKAEFAYVKDDSAKTTASIAEIAAYLHKQYALGKTSRVLVAYTDYQSTVLQTPVVKQLFPLIEASSITAAVDNISVDTSTMLDYIYEPNKLDVLEYVIPRLTEVQLYQALLESNASEHSARMLAMKNATDAAGDMIDELVLAFNRARQATITKEIAEISAGTAAVA
ncbi:MAG: ATP synthase F1 subunit gamma [Patescibacteria group bacterium]